MFKNFVIFSSIIFIHELGHILVSLYFEWNIDKIIILPFGGITIFKEAFNKPLIEEFCIAIAGPIFQVIFYLCCGKNNLLFTLYHYSILVFNLLPIVPLDGSKILSIILYYFFPFKKTGYMVLLFSCATMISVIAYGLYFNYSMIFLVVLFFLALEIVKQWGKQKYYFQKFLLERYLYHFHFKKEKIIEKVEQMQKEKRHLLKIGQNYYTEREFLRKKFDK